MNKDKNRPLKIGKNYVDINQLMRRCYHNDITEQVIREFKDFIPFIVIVQKMQLSKDFLREILENKDLQLQIAANQHLDEKFIEEWKNKLNWTALSYTKNNFSQQFLLKWSEKIDWEAIWKINRKWSQEFWEYLKKKVGR